MRINHNIAALNTYRQLGANNAKSSNSLEKLSSGLRINRAGDDAAGLAISEKMRGQIRGLEQAQRNSQDGISMIQTAEGALNETHAILQRMRELAAQSANDTNVGIDREEIQKEINQLSSEINRIGNTTEFNNQSLLKGDGKVSLADSGLVSVDSLSGGADAYKTQAKRTDGVTVAAVAADTVTYTINGEDLAVTFAASGANGEADHTAYNVGSNAATINIDGTQSTDETATDLAASLQAMIDENDTLKGNYTVTANGSDVVFEAVADADFDGAAGSISSATVGGTGTVTLVNDAANTNAGENVAAVAASTSIDFTATGLDITSQPSVEALVGTGMTINGTQVEFYNANDGAYSGDAVGINLSDAINAGANYDQAVATAVADQLGQSVDGITTSEAAGVLTVTASAAGAAGNDIAVADGGIEADFQATFQVGANKNQSFTIEISDMRADALGLTGVAGDDGFTAANTVTDGTDNNAKEAALDVSSHDDATAAIKVINDAIETVSAERSKLGASQNRLEHTINNLGTSAENLTAAESRIRDVDMAKEMMDFTKNNILTQAAQAMLAQANQQPQGVLQLLR